MDPNHKEILLTLIHSEQQTINSISQKMGYSIPTATKYVREMLKCGLLISQDCSDSCRGRKPAIYSANPNAFYFVGVDIGRYSLYLGIMNLVGELVYEECREDFLFENTPQCLDTICRYIMDFLNRNNFDKSQITMMNINISGRVDTEKGYCHSTFNFEGNDLPLADVITQNLGIKTIICNDTQAMTYGELIFGVGRQMSNFLFVNAGWGIGLGIVINGQVYTGMNGYAGEIGHINVYDNEVLCHCGKKGCLETEVSGRALFRKLIQRVGEGEVSVLSSKIASGQTVSTNNIISAAIDEDLLCLDIVEKLGAEMGRQLANLINIFNPEAIVIGGNLSRAEEYLLEPIRQGIRKYSLRLINKDLTVMRTHNHEKIGILGACVVARERLFREDSIIKEN